MNFSKCLLALTASLLVCIDGHAYQEAPQLSTRVDSGDLPPVEERLPEIPQVTELEGPFGIGQYGGQMRMLMAKPKDARMAMIYGYARLVGYTARFDIVPDILRDVDVEDGRVFTLHLRPGHRWSDGHPFTTEDFRYYWEDVANNDELSAGGPPRELLIEGEPPAFEILDEHTVRLSWSKPNPYFLPALAGARPLMIYRASHYLKQFHPRYVDEAELEKMVNEAGKRNWSSLHVSKDRWYKLSNPELPMLQPWVPTVAPPTERFVFARNPYFHRVDQAGNQLPYVDELVFNIASSSLIPAKTGTGESDLQARYLRLDNYTFLKSGEERNGYEVRLWRKGTGSQMALFPNLNANDPVWREVMRDVKFRRALSLAVHRHEINQVIYFGLVQESNNTVLSNSPLFRPKYQGQWAEFDLEKANRLLDEMELTQRDDKGLRLLPDGRPMEIVVQTAGESSEEADILELIHDSWLKLGIKLHTRPSQREVFRSRTFAGDSIMGALWGLDNALVSADNSPAEFTPSTQYQMQWPKWGQYYETGGSQGEKPELEPVLQLADLRTRWEQATDSSTREAVWHEILDLYCEQVYSIGTVNNVPQPVVVNKRLKNVPEEGLYTWEPTSYFGAYRPDTFFFAGDALASQ